MEPWNCSHSNITSFVEGRRKASLPSVNKRLQMHPSFIQRLSLEKYMEGHQGCVNALAWNSKGSLLISGAEDARMNIWNYNNLELMHSIEIGHGKTIFCTKFVPETSDEVVVSGARDGVVRLFNLSHSRGKRSQEELPEPLALFRCHCSRVKKLAVEVGNPNVVWSASEDGTLRQHDIREVASCPLSNEECRSVLLDLRQAEKKSLADPPRQCLALKSCDISPSRPEQILVGGSDAFARLYDRRMLAPLSSDHTAMKAPTCINYFCPMHLSHRRKPSLHLTHVSFSPNGEEVLLSYSGEHVYLMDVNFGDRKMSYTADDVPKQLYLAPLVNETDVPSQMVDSTNQSSKTKSDSSRLAMCKKLIKVAAETLKEGSNLFFGIEVCNEVIDRKGPEVSLELMLECLCIRAALLLKRSWKNDVHMAIRDCNKARSIDALSFKAHHYMSEALLKLGKHKEAFDYAVRAHQLVPSNSEAKARVLSMKDCLAAAEADNSNRDSKRTAMSEVRHGRLRSLSDVLFRPDNSETSQAGHLYNGEDSDFNEEIEVDFETSISTDEVHNIVSRIVQGSLNLKIFKRADSNESGNNQPEDTIDMRQRYIGHCNVGTDIKQATFLGQLGEFVSCGSDDGRWFIWEKRTGRLIKMLAGDKIAVNCIQCHPFDCTVATSGIDYTIKVWTPHASVPSIVAGGTAGPETQNVSSVIESNQRRLGCNPETVMPFEFLERFRMHEFAAGELHPSECAQS